LGPAEVVGVSGVDFAVPVDGESKPFDLSAEVFDVGFGGDGGVGAGFDGVLLGGKSKGVPTHGVKYVVTVGFFVAGQDVGGGVAFGVSNVQSSSRGVGEHVQGVVLRLICVVDGLEGVLGFPVFLPVWLNFREFVGVAVGSGHVVLKKLERGGFRYFGLWQVWNGVWWVDGMDKLD